MHVSDCTQHLFPPSVIGVLASCFLLHTCDDAEGIEGLGTRQGQFTSLDIYKAVLLNAKSIMLVSDVLCKGLKLM